MIENFVKRLLQKIFGFRNYLFIFSIFSINRLRWGRIEKEFLEYMKLVPDEGIILDLGANIGIMTAHLASRRKKATVYSFEPIAENLATLKRIIRYYHLSNVKVFECALGDANGEIKMVMPVIGDVKMQGLSHVVHEGAAEEQAGQFYTVPLRKLDEIPELNEKDVKITAIKIDVENFEYFVLKGGRNLLAKHHPVIYSELWNNETRSNTIAMLSELGYSVKVNEHGKLVAFNGQEAQNFIFVYPHQAEGGSPSNVAHTFAGV
jgi:FkbM family methyltransferase